MRLLSRLRAARERDPALFRLRVALAAALVALLLVLVGGNPADGVPERLAEGKPPRGIDYWRTHGWWMALANSALLAGLIATAGRWFKRGPAPEVAALAPPAGPSPAVVGLVVLAMLAGAALAAPRLGHSFWDDEEYNVMHSIDGQYLVDREGGVRFREVQLRDTLWFYAIPNNHVFHTVLARLSVEAWRLVARPDTHFVSETATRLPAWLAGIASIGAVAWWLWRIGFASAAVVAAWLLAIHPWHLRFGSEARGYSLVMLGVSVTIALAIRALHRGTWGRWAALGVAQFLLLWTYPGLAVHVAVLNLAVGGLLLHWHRGALLRDQATRWLAANLLGAMAWLQLMLPNLAQLAAYNEGGGGSGMGAGWLRSVGSHLLAGMPWTNGRRAAAVYPELKQVLDTSPVFLELLLAVVVGALLVGTLRLLHAGGPRALLVAVLLLPPPLVYALGVWQDANLFVWYLVFALPALAALVALGLTAPAAAGRRGAVAAAVASVAFLAGHLWLTTPARNALLERSYKPGRESAQVARPDLDPLTESNERILTATYRYFNRLYYDPRGQVVRGIEDLEALIERADAEGLALYANFQTLDRIERYDPELLAAVRDPARFEHVAHLPGFEPRFTREVYRYLGASRVD